MVFPFPHTQNQLDSNSDALYYLARICNLTKSRSVSPGNIQHFRSTSPSGRRLVDLILFLSSSKILTLCGNKTSMRQEKEKHAAQVADAFFHDSDKAIKL